MGSDDYSDIGTEALAAGRSASGGLGIARMIMKDPLKRRYSASRRLGGKFLAAKVWFNLAD